MLLKKETYPNQVVDFIKTMIQNGDLKQGDPIKESNLAERLSISRAPIREALQQLVSEGLVTSKPQKGKHVKLLSAKDIRDSYEVGGILESAGVADSLVFWTEKDIEELHTILQSMQTLSVNSKAADSFIELDEEFHGLLLKYCNNPKLIEMARLSCANISKFLCYHRWLHLYSPYDFYERHLHVADAIFTKDIKILKERIRTHYKEIGERISKEYE